MIDDLIYPGGRWLRLLPTIGFAMLAIFLVSFMLDVQHAHDAKKPVAPTVESSPLGLRVTSEPERVEVFWDHGSSAIKGAEQATIRISDGDMAESVPFDAKQLQDGSLVYRPRTNDISIRMEVNERDGRRISESVRAVTTP
jgi:hypothetical protein